MFITIFDKSRTSTLKCKSIMRILLIAFLLSPFVSLAQSGTNLLKTAESNIEKTNYKEAINNLNTLIGQEPKNKEAFIKRGYVKNILGDFYGAIGDYNFALDLDSTSSEALNNRGEAKFNLGDDYGAIEDFDK